MNNCCSISLRIDDQNRIPLRIKEESSVSLNVGGDFYAVGPPYYDGAYDITPSESVQVLEMKDMRASSNVTINPIPSNYGLITWDGSRLTVS